ncbi:hypothetical protein CS0771_69070 [Catellatospora sp. IY07-71]|uniref:hypothetical protein n=1 Tax=Catellatospora sp. IY07-71 TaxID=2728827 RepID=UPI001BB33C96|nr:hypothetical protein [Catellatospora sp. IY07-71]BCJ77363.1 hypothetical protein CS0771_69070 [Catellatospora sp. IY07-71]
MRFALFTPEGTRRLTPDAPGRMMNLIGFWVPVTLVVFGIPAVIEEQDGLDASHIVGLVAMLYLARFFRRPLIMGVFASETALYLCGAGDRRIEIDQIQTFTLRSDEQHPRVLWVDLIDGRRYPTPAYLGDTTGTGLALTRAEMDALIAELTRRLPRPATADSA